MKKIRLTTKLIKADIPSEIEVLYPMWRYGGMEPGIYRPWKSAEDDIIWAWVPHPVLGSTLAQKRVSVHV